MLSLHFGAPRVLSVAVSVSTGLDLLDVGMIRFQPSNSNGHSSARAVYLANSG